VTEVLFDTRLYANSRILSKVVLGVSVVY